MVLLYGRISETYDDGAIFQLDNDPSHISNSTMSWLKQRGTTLLGWPASSPDLSPAEDAIEALVHLVYADSRKFSSKAALSQDIAKCWQELNNPSKIYRFHE